MLERVLLSADVVYNGVGLPIEDGALLAAGGRIVAFGTLEALRAASPDVRPQRAGRAILPRPANAHAHLDMSRYPYRPAPYPEWIRGVIATGRSDPSLRGVEAAREGLAALRASGAAAFGDVTNKPAVVEFLLAEADLPGVVHWEVLDPNPATADATLAATRERVRRWRRLERPGGPRLGLSPHAVHTVSARLLRGLADLARAEGLPVQIHAAEAPDELAFFASGAGRLADAMLPVVGLRAHEILGRAPGPDLTPVGHLAALGVLEARPTLVHAVHVTEDDVRAIASAGCAVVHCPRSNRALECGILPWAAYARHGVEVALGTDGVASGGTLDLRDEAEAALEAHGGRVSLRSVVRAAVKGGHRALGLRPPVVRRGDPIADLAVW